MNVWWKGTALASADGRNGCGARLCDRDDQGGRDRRLPGRALWVQEFTNFFIPEVDKRLAETGNYEMDWQESYGGSIVKPKGVLEGIQLGLGDIGIVTTIFHSSKLPSQAISAVTPFVAPDARAVAKAVDEIAREFPTMQNEFAAQNQVYLATGVVLDTYQVFSTERGELDCRS